MTKYGFLGLGIMGLPMAKNLLASGCALTVWNRSGEKCAPLVEAGAKQADTPAAVVAASDITFAMVAGPEASRELFFMENGVQVAIEEGKGYVDSTTVDPGTSLELHQAISERGGRFLEAPVSGSRKPAKDGNLIFLCAGHSSLYQECLQPFEVMGRKSFFLEEVGNAARMKLVINMIMGTMMAGFSEGLALGAKSGLQPAQIIEVLRHGTIGNPMFALKGPLMIEDTFTTAFPLKYMQKDMRLALELGDELAQSLPVSGTANANYIRSRNLGFGDEDFSAILKAILS